MTRTLQRTWPDWFTDGYAQAAFERHLLPLAGKPYLHFLQIGAYSGDATQWLVNNVLTNPQSGLVDVDTWQGSNEPDHKDIDFDVVFDYYLQRVDTGRVAWYRGTSDEFFSRYWGTTKYDFVYVDGSHETEQVLRDAVHADRLLNPGGMIAFDDYLWGGHMRNIPRPAIDAFLRCFEGQYEVLEKDLQVWVRKRG